MKKLLLSIVLTLVVATSFGQGGIWTMDFDSPPSIWDFGIVNRDTVSNPNCVWQIGSPSKTIFASAHSVPNAIVTDTVNSYPTNDTSIFTIRHLAGQGWNWHHTVGIAGYYQVNSDTLTDFGTIEVSPDNGSTWIDVVNDTAYASVIYWVGDKPTFSGNSNGWQYFMANFYGLPNLFNVQIGDTIRYRFTFISDSAQTNKDGLMFDDLHFEDYAEGIDEVQNDNLISVSPNPTSEVLQIHRTKVSDKQTIQILNYTGQVLYANANFIGTTIDTRQLANGIYLLKYSDTKSFSIKKFIVQH